MFYYQYKQTFVISSYSALKYIHICKNKFQEFFFKSSSSPMSLSFLRPSKNKQPIIQLDIHELPFTYPQILSDFIATYKKVRATRKITVLLAWTGLCIPLQSVFIKLPGATKIKFGRFFWRTVCRILGVKLRIFGKLAEQKTQSETPKRPIIYIANHTSWLDIAVAGGLLPAAFVAKEEVSSWPIVSTVARLGRVVFISRQRQSTAKEQQNMEKKLEQGENLIFFPEGTSTEGSHVFPFMSSFFVLAKPISKNISYTIPIIQPISIVYDRIGMLPVNRLRRPICSWYGDMELAPHLWDFCKWSDVRASIIYHQPLYPENFKNRKQLAQKAWDIIVTGTACLRQRKSNEDIKKII